MTCQQLGERYICAAVLVLLACIGCTRHYRVEGVVLRVDPQSVLVSHRAISGYMGAMAMPFGVKNAADLRGVGPGSRIEFHLNVGRDGSFIDHVRVKQARLEDVKVPAPDHKLAIGDAVPDVELIDQTGSRISLSQFRGRPVAIDFIYTRCPLPDVCPRLSANFALLQKRFGPKLVLLSTTIDPVYDTPAVLADYAQRWAAGPDWRFLTGSPDAIQQMAGYFGLIYWPEEGSITHTSATAIVGPDGRLQALLEGSSFTARQLVDLVEVTLQRQGLPFPDKTP